jgi:ADP-ribose pyrophosphatase YjhB (NUDIX family)
MNGTVLENLNPESPEFKRALARELGKLDPAKPVGTELCDAIMRLWPTPAFEAMAFRLGKSGQPEIYLRRRSMDETVYPGEWHAPGSLYRHGEQDCDVANRLEKEFGVKIEVLVLVDKEITSEARGTVHSYIFLVKLAGEPRLDDRHGWFPTNDLPQTMVDLHRDLIIPVALKHYRFPRGIVR